MLSSLCARLGSVGGDAVALVHASRSAPPAEGRWEVTQRVGFDLPLVTEQDMHLHLDAVLPRVVELATSSMVYREKAAACELLEACVKLCIGRNAERARSSQRPTHLTSILYHPTIQLMLPFVIHH